MILRGKTNEGELVETNVDAYIGSIGVMAHTISSLNPEDQKYSRMVPVIRSIVNSIQQTESAVEKAIHPVQLLMGTSLWFMPIEEQASFVARGIMYRFPVLQTTLTIPTHNNYNPYASRYNAAPVINVNFEGMSDEEIWSKVSVRIQMERNYIKFHTPEDRDMRTYYSQYAEEVVKEMYIDYIFAIYKTLDLDTLKLLVQTSTNALVNKAETYMNTVISKYEGLVETVEAYL